MNPRINLIINSLFLLVLSPFIGMMVAGIVFGLLESALLILAAISGVIASLFFQVNWNSFIPKWEIIESVSLWLIAITGSIGGIIWSILAIREKYDRYKTTGRGWTE